jgi:hypothetical protein
VGSKLMFPDFLLTGTIRNTIRNPKICYILKSYKILKALKR